MQKSAEGFKPAEPQAQTEGAYTVERSLFDSECRLASRRRPR